MLHFGHPLQKSHPTILSLKENKNKGLFQKWGNPDKAWFPLKPDQKGGCPKKNEATHHNQQFKLKLSPKKLCRAACPRSAHPARCARS